ncbi:hypothetical protein Y032_0703g1667 [Ancylostoma ceylanicum]|uniref:Uncharacterized protein n=1 Tax=Ancylostoma ceylanicum TaxID=53326 RepID=A0A016WGA5_9BILA|nr:hypothetical protein Y032_0703g1667 [Ancylostoma ceylanicum]
MKDMLEDLAMQGFKQDRFHSDPPAWPLALPLLESLNTCSKHSFSKGNCADNRFRKAPEIGQSWATTRCQQVDAIQNKLLATFPRDFVNCIEEQIKVI